MPSSAARVPAYVTHQSLQGHTGGASAVTAWVLQALCRDFDVWLATPDAVVDFQQIDDAYGTSLATEQVGICQLQVPRWLRRVPERKLKSVRLAATFRDPRLQQDGAGLIFNTANEMGFRGPSVSYVHCPIRHPRMVAELYRGRERWLRHLNNAAFKVIAGFDEDLFRQSLCVANSGWTAAALRRAYGLDAEVIYPPVLIPGQPAAGLRDRSPGFVCVGRISAEKRTHEAIELIDALRGRGHDAHLHIVGNGNGAYAHQVEAAAAERSYVELHRNIPRNRLAALMNEHRFGLHLMHNEHFGMAVAEMTAAGMLVLAHRSAGPLEILGPSSQMLFTDLAGAADIADRLLASESMQADVQADIAERRIHDRFSPGAFMGAVRRAAEKTLLGRDHGNSSNRTAHAGLVDREHFPADRGNAGAAHAAVSGRDLQD